MALVVEAVEPAGLPEPGSKLRQPSRLRLVDDVATSIEDAILAGRMRPGERLIEMRLCAELGVSRTTLREALLMLERGGLVRSEPRRGTFVTRLSREGSLDLCLTRALLEAYAVVAGYDRLDDETFAAMEALLAELASCTLPDDVPRLIQIDLAFHTHLIGAVDSPGVRELWTSLNGKMSALILSSLEHHHASIADVVGFHRVLLDAVRSGDRHVAREAVITHYVGDEGDGLGTLAEMALVIETMARRSPAAGLQHA